MTGLAVLLLSILFSMTLVLLGRYTLLILGLFLPLLPLVVPPEQALPTGAEPALWLVAALCLFAARPSWLRRGHRDRITRSPA